jgi:uncharacterized Zn finger protein
MNKTKNFTDSINNFLNTNRTTKSYTKANEYNNEKCITNITIDLEKNIIQAKIKGTRSYITKLYINVESLTLHSTCSCPVEDEDCKHSLGLSMFCKEHINKLVNLQTQKNLKLDTQLNSLTTQQLLQLTKHLISDNIKNENILFNYLKTIKHNKLK